MSKEKDSFTVCAKIEDNSAINFLREYGLVFGRILRKLHVDLNIKECELNDLKSSYQQIFGIISRHFNSLRFILGGKWSARLEQYTIEIEEIQSGIKSVTKNIFKKQREIDKNSIRIQKIEAFRAKKCEWLKTHKGRKPSLAKSLKFLRIEKLKEENAKHANFIKMKKIKLSKLHDKLLAKEKRLEKKSLCFGGEKLFKKQYNLENTPYDSHREWKVHWDLQRNGSSFWVGSKDEKNGNQIASYNRENKEVRLRVPPCLDEKYGQYINVPIQLEEKMEESFLNALNRKTAISYKFLEKIETTRSGQFIKEYDSNGDFVSFKTSMYCHISFTPPEPEDFKTSPFLGVLGIDLNADHMALVETDRHGNPISNYTFPFKFSGKTSVQRSAIMSDHIANICDFALNTGKPVVIEALDFYKSKLNLKEKAKGPFYNKMLSQFQFADFKKRIKSRARKLGVEIIGVNPCFTSIIGAYKFRGYSKLSNHHLAALVIARRALGYSERPKIVTDVHRPDRMDGLDVGTALEFQNSSQRKRSPKHIWSFWRFNTKQIRKQMINSGKNKTSIKTKFIANPCRPSGFFATMEVLLDCDEGGSISSFLHDLDDWSKVRPASV